MDIAKLKKYIALSNEDFADAHEPVNDGVKEVPNAEDIAREVGRSTEGDITSSGDAKVIPEKEDDEENTSEEVTPEMDTVIENTDTPASPEKPAPSEPVESDAEPVDVTENGAEDDELPDDDTGLAHDNVKAINADEDITTNDKESLENFNVKRAETIGYTKRQTLALTNSIARLRHRAGVKGEFTISAESIQEAIGYADAHLTKLRKKGKILAHRELQIAKENFVETESELEMNQRPLVTPGAEPLTPEQGAAITQAELAPILDTVIEEQAIANTYQAIETLERAGVAVEKFTTLLRANKGRLSKQAAAIIHVSLEHIDRECELKVRATGLENYDTTPRSSMEAADVDEKTLSGRAAQIGAKIVKFLKSLLEKAKELFKKVTQSNAILEEQAAKLVERIAGLKGTPKKEKFSLNSTREDMFIGNDFVALAMTRGEGDVLRDTWELASKIVTKLVGPLTAAVKNNPEEIESILDTAEQMRTTGNSLNIELPGNYEYKRKGIVVNFDHEGNGNFPDTVEVDVLSTGELRRNASQVVKQLELMDNAKVYATIERNTEHLLGAINMIRLDSKKDEGFDENEFQKMQSRIIDGVVKPFDIVKYTTIMNKLAQFVAIRIATLNLVCDQYDS